MAQGHIAEDTKQHLSRVSAETVEQIEQQTATVARRHAGAGLIAGHRLIEEVTIQSRCVSVYQRRSLIEAPLVAYPTLWVAPPGIMVGPVNHAALIVPRILSVQLHAGINVEALHSGRQLKVVGHQQGLS